GGEETRVRGFDLRILLRRCVECAMDGVEGFEELFLCAFPLVDHGLEVLGRASAPAFLESQQIAQHRLRLGHEIARSACGGGGSGLDAFGVDFETHDGSSRSVVRLSRPARAGRDQCRPHCPGRKGHGKRVWTALGCPHPPRGRVVTASPGPRGRVRTPRGRPVRGPWTGRSVPQGAGRRRDRDRCYCSTSGTSTFCSCPPRTRVISTGVFTGCARTRARRAMALFTLVPATSMMSSPSLSPALSAGVPPWTDCTLALPREMPPLLMWPSVSVMPRKGCRALPLAMS